MDDGFGYWLAGFIDGEGCFTIQRVKKGSWYCRFAIRVRDDDSAIIQKIQEETGIGRVCPVSARGTSRAQVAWVVVSKADCIKLVALLDQYPLRAKKRHDFAIWKRAVEAWKLQHSGKIELVSKAVIERCAQELRTGRAYLNA